MTPWKLPLIVAGIAAPIIAAFAIGGGGGLAAGSIAVLVIVVFAIRAVPRGPIESAAATDERRHVLIVSPGPVEDPADVARIARATGLGGGRGSEDDAEVVVLVPARIGFLDRWASDVEGARHRAQQHLVATVAALAKAGVAAEARVGDEDIVQAVEDQLQGYPATEVILVSGDGEDVEAAAGELGSRLRAEFLHIDLSRSAEGQRS
ncbi:MAG: hypothetical protein ACRDLL_05580 [Solirubrobacterales bacterium]